MKSEKQMAELEKAAKILRNCRKIEHRMHQLEKQLYLGHTTAYGIIMGLIHPNYKEHREQVRNSYSGNKPRSTEILSETALKDNETLAVVEKEISDGK